MTPTLRDPLARILARLIMAGDTPGEQRARLRIATADGHFDADEAATIEKFIEKMGEGA